MKRTSAARCCFLVVAIALASVARSAAAHPLDMGYLRLDGAAGEVAITLDIDVSVAEGILKVERLDAATAAARATELAAATYRMAAPAIDGVACTWTTASAKIVGRSVSMADRARCPTGARLTWELPFVRKMSSTFQVLAKVRAFDQERVAVLEKERLTIEIAGSAPAPGFGGAVWNGIAHAGLGPSEWKGERWPIDHLVFALALVLAGGALLRILSLVGLVAFAHGIGAVLAFAGVESAGFAGVFPLAIGMVAACATTPRLETLRWVMAAIAGALHGLGTTHGGAGALAGFCVGFALALVAIALAIGPLVAMAHREPAVRTWGVRAAAIAIGAASVYWFVRAL